MISREEVLLEVGEFVGECVRRSGLDLQHSCELDEDAVNIFLEGPDGSLVLRDNARLLYAINHLVNQVFFRRADRKLAFVVDCEEYRSGRVLELQLLARKAAEKVRDTGKPFRLQPMPANERRIIHLALSEEPGVTTESEGSGTHRRVVLVPSG